MAPWYLYAILYATMAVNLGTGCFNIVQGIGWHRRWMAQIDKWSKRWMATGYLAGYEAGKRAHYASD